MDFELIGEIKNVRLIAENKKIRILQYLIESYWKGYWRKLSGEVPIFDNGEKYIVEVHYYEASGLGRFEFKIIEKVREIDKGDL